VWVRLSVGVLYAKTSGRQSTRPEPVTTGRGAHRPATKAQAASRSDVRPRDLCPAAGTDQRCGEWQHRSERGTTTSASPVMRTALWDRFSRSRPEVRMDSRSPRRPMQVRAGAS